MTKLTLKSKADARVYYNEGHFTDRIKEQIIIVNSYRSIISVAVLDKTTMSYVKEIPLDYFVDGVSGCRFYMFDTDRDGLEELYFDYARNDSLYLMILNPGNGSVKEIFLYRRIPMNGFKGNDYSIHISDIIAVEKEKNSVLAVACSAAWGKPRTLTLVDPRSGIILKEKHFPTVIRKILYSEGNYYLNLYAYYNGVECDGRKDTFASIMICDSLLNTVDELCFPGYTGALMLVDTTAKVLQVTEFSLWDKQKFPTKLFFYDLQEGEIFGEKNLGNLIPSPASIFTKDKKLPLINEGERKIFFYDERGKVLRKLTMDTKGNNQIFPIQMYYPPLEQDVFLINENDNVRVFDLKGKEIISFKGRYMDSYGNYLRFFESNGTSIFNIVEIVRNSRYTFRAFLIVSVAFALSLVVIGFAELFFRHLFLTLLWGIYSKNSLNAIAVVAGGRIIARNRRNAEYDRLFREISEKHMKNEYETRSLKFEQKILNAEIIPFKIPFIEIYAISLNDITNEIMNENYKMLINATTLIAHDIKNAMTSLKAAKLVMEMKGKKFDGDIAGFFEKMDRSNKEILESCDNIMQMLYKDIVKVEFYAMPLIMELKGKYERAISMEISGEDISINADRQLLKYALSNFMENAVHETFSRKEKTIKVNVGKKDGAVSITIENSSRYLDDETVRKIENGGYSTKPDGNGFGYRISKMLIESLGGTVKITSDEEMTTTSVEVTLY